MALATAQITTAWSTNAKTARGVRMEERVIANPLDADAWVVLLAEAAEQKAADYRPLFERCVKHFPSAACVWYQWIDAEQRGNHLSEMEALFKRCLLHCPHVELWRLYLHYLRHVKRVESKELQQAYEVLLEAVGMDVGAGALWSEYVSVLSEHVSPEMLPNSGPVTTARDAYQRALVQPAAGLESMWKEYETWEATQSGGNAKALLAEIADRALVARRVARERQALAQPLKLNRMPRVPRGTQAEFEELTNWRNLWTYEATNPQRLPMDKLQLRMNFTFNQALMVLWFSPQVWHEAAEWMRENGHAGPAREFYKRALEVLKDHELLTLAFARLHEGEGQPSEARELLESLLLVRPTPLVYIHLMRVVRRSEGAQAARLVFARARRAEGATWHVYAAAAQLEYQMGGGGGGGGGGEEEEEDGGVIAARILALALDRFEEEVSLALYCVEFLLQRCDVTNARAVLERTLKTQSGGASRELWGAYLDLEMVYGSPTSVHAVSERRAAALPGVRVPALYQLASLHSFLGLWPADERELRGLAEEAHVVEVKAGGEEGAATGAAGAASSGAIDLTNGPGPMVMPQLELCVEYTGEPIILDGPQPVAAVVAGGAAAGGAEAAAMASVVPYQIEALLEALPTRAVTDDRPKAADVQRLFERLSQLPDRLADLQQSAAAAAALPGGGGGFPGADQGGAPPSKIPRGNDAFTARQRKKMELMGQSVG